MIRLYRVELRRFAKRRATRIMAGLVIVIFSVAAGFIFVTHEQMPSNEEAIERAERERASCEANERAFFQENEGRLGFDNEEEWVQDNCGWIRPQNFFNDNRFCLLQMVEKPNATSGCERADRISQGLQLDSWNDGPDDIFPGYAGILPLTSTVLLFLAVILPASFIGAEYRSGTMENLLLWEPRRLRVAGAKVLAGMTWAAALHIALLGFLLAVMFPSAALRGTTAGADGGFWLLVANLVFRGGIGAALIAALAMAVTLITRFSAGAIASAIGYAIVASFTIPVLAKGLLHRDLAVNTQAWMRISDVPRWERVQRRQGWTEDVFPYAHGSLVAGLYLAAWAALTLGLALWLFNRRDVD